MREQKTVKLYRGITGVSDDLIEEARTAPAGKKTPAWRRWGALAACLCLAVLAGAGAWRWMGTAAGTSDPCLAGPVGGGLKGGDGTDDTRIGGEESGETAGRQGGFDHPGLDGGTLPGGFTPVLRVGDTLYQWTGIAQRVFLDSGGSYNIMGTSDTYLPEGYEPYGALGGVSTEEPLEELQLQAGFEASGTVFVSGEYPAVVYVLMTTSWFEDAYVRFVSAELGNNELLSWQGRMYRFSIGTGISELVEELPEGCELVGKLHVVSGDCVPTGDLETNVRMGDSYGKPLEGREVYAVPGDDSVLYVYEHHYWREGDYPAWRACHLWER